MGRAFQNLWVVLLLFCAFHAQAQLRELGNGSPGPVKAPHLSAELQTGGPALAPGSTGDLALVFELDPGWHVYWVQAGDSGEPPEVDWILPAGLKAGPMQFPAPKRLPLGPLMDYGYEGTAVFPFTLEAEPSLKPGHVLLQAHVRWLVCREVCLPGKGFLGAALNIQPGAAAGTNPLIEAAKKGEPQPLPPGFTVKVIGGPANLQLSIQSPQKETSAQFYPFDADAIANAAPQKFAATASGATLALERADATAALPKRLKGVLELNGGRSYLIDEPVGTAAAVSSSATSASTGVLLPLLLAFGGGLILNLMPCVFPVLFIKALSLLQGVEGRQTHRRHGFAYTAGVLVSFWSIVAVLLGLRAAGHQAGWGFQLQSPPFVAMMASLLFFMALSLGGQFDLGLSLTGSGDALARKGGYTGSFFTGVLATVVATPCTAPLMGAAIGYALAQSAFVTFAVFTALALGLALPYLLLTLQPAWARLLPKPGRWMETLKQLTAVPLLLTVVWLVWVYGRLYSAAAGEGADHIARLLGGFVLLAIAGWMLGRWPAQRRGALAATVLVAASLFVSLSSPKADALAWQPFSEEAVEQARAQGHPVFVDFTAAWCLSCQVNERVVLHAGEIEKQFQEHHYVLLRADWTRYDPAITKQLAAVDRSGVPTYVIYPAPSGAAPQVLPELLTESVMRNALGQTQAISRR